MRISRGAAAALLLASCAAAAPLDPNQERRVEMGTGWFRGMLMADVDIEKKALADGKLLVVFLYTEDARRARELAKAFAEGAPIRKRLVVAEAVAEKDLPSYTSRVPAGIFLVQPPEVRALRDIVGFGRARRALVYSPFEGHVEEGVPGGLAVEAQVRAFINEKALAASGITLKDLFLQAAKVYR
jgi:hypothetical protein